MQNYEMAFLGRLEFVVTRCSFEGEDDGAALAHAHGQCGTHKIAVTQDGRRVGEVARGASLGVPLAPAVTAVNRHKIERKAPRSNEGFARAVG